MTESFRFDAKALCREAAEPGAFERPRRVRFHEIDAAGIVFFARVLDYVHDNYCEYLDAVGHGLPAVLEAGEWAAPIGHVEVDYFEPLRFGDELQLVIAKAHIDGSRLSLAHQIRKVASGRVACVAQTVHVFVSRREFRPIPIPEALLLELAKLPPG